ncbi:MAG TPA: type II toxin-antitoxin system VapC family toxin [Casimicrobiaceae bacterium]|nr:type II toxin-antitoxin system VapC family toxin [Casimicrobiaceae bacterium]
MIVVDASALIEVLLNTSAAPRIADRLFDRGETLHAPHLLDVEVAQVLRRYARTGEISAPRADAALEDFTAFPIARYPHQPFLPRIWQLRNNATAYEAAYLALAEVLDAPLLTRDSRLARSIGHRARIELARSGS